MTLYRKYRPQTINELDLESVREELTRLVSVASIPHAILFTGPKGTGKTSAARILAKIVNCENLQKNHEPCNLCSQCLSITAGNNLDVIELDAASNRGIDDIRAIREEVVLAPSLAKKKIYIIDEVHMLTTEAANALLKTLEEPPDHVIFILATTDPQKLPATIISRLRVINFTQGSTSEILRELSRVVDKEKIKVDQESLTLIAKSAGGSFRDAVKILEGFVDEHNNIDHEKVVNSLLQTSLYSIDQHISLFKARDSKQLLSEIEKIISNGGSIKIYTNFIIQALREMLLGQEFEKDEKTFSLTKAELISLIELFLAASAEIAISPIPQLPIEIAVIKWCSQKSTSQENKIKTSEDKIDTENTSTTKEDALAPQTSSAVSLSISGDGQLDNTLWFRILSEVRAKHSGTEALLRAAAPKSFDGQRLCVGVYYRFHKEQLEVLEHKRLIEDVAAQVLGVPIKIFYELTERDKMPTKTNTPIDKPLTHAKDEDIIQAAKEIFGN